MFVKGNISVVSLLTLFSARRSAEMPVERMKKRGDLGGEGYLTFTHQADFF